MTPIIPVRPQRAPLAETAPGEPPLDETPESAPEPFRRAVESIQRTRVRHEVRVEPIRPPQRLAPWTYAVAADVTDAEGDELATGRLVLLYDPDGVEAWDGTLRLVAFASAELDADMVGDPLLSEVGWSWLTSALHDRSAAHVAAGGTVTQTTSTRFGDLHGPHTTVALELRGSWTPSTDDIGPHLLAFVDLLCTAAGLPPEGVTVLKSTS
ncbi:MAG: DUF3000 domain-containing protein [Actinomycetota bacterium]